MGPISRGCLDPIQEGQGVDEGVSSVYVNFMKIKNLKNLKNGSLGGIQGGGGVKLGILRKLREIRSGGEKYYIFIFRLFTKFGFIYKKKLLLSPLDLTKNTIFLF